MNKATSSSSSSGIGFLGVLTIVFVVLKLLDKIDWSWWWVLSPLWIPFVAVASVATLIAICYGVAIFFDSLYKSHKRKQRMQRKD
jgi:hypothetical protein